MKIDRISVFVVRHDAGIVNTRYVNTDKMSVDLETSILRVETDTGLSGWGETCTAPSYYLPTLASGARAAIGHIAPLLLGEDPRNPNRLMDVVRTAMRGQFPARSAVDMALRDLHGKILGIPLVDLWGGRAFSDLPVMCLVDEGSPELMLEETAAYRAQGYKLYQMKIGEGTAAYEIERIEALMADRRSDEQFWFDPNREWTFDKAMEILPHVAHLAPFIEQPCETYRECLAVARRCGIGLMLDEVMSDQDRLIQAASDGIVRVAVLKMSCTGGLTQHRQMAELAGHLGVPCRIEDFYGTGLTFAAVTHLAHSLPAATTYALYDYIDDRYPVVCNPLEVRNARVAVPDDAGPGLGCEVNETFLGEPVAEYVDVSSMSVPVEQVAG